EEFAIDARAGLVEEANAHQLAAMCRAPLPAGFDRERGAEGVFLPQEAIDGEEGRSATIAHQRTIFQTDLEGPGLTAAIDEVGVLDFAIDAQRVGRIDRVPPDKCIAAVVDADEPGVLEHKLVTQMRARVIPLDLHLVRSPAVSEGEADAEVVAGYIAVLRQSLADDRAAIDVELPTLRAEVGGVSVAQQASPAADRAIQKRVAADFA